jgi:hypothetical protein
MALLLRFGIDKPYQKPIQMKYFSALLVVFAVLASGIAQAQTAVALNGQSYTYVMKNINGTGDEIQDMITFQNNTMSSQVLGSRGYSSSRVIEKTGSTGTSFEVTMNSKSEGTQVFRGTASGATIEGTITVTDKQGVQSTMAFRGMTTEAWHGVQEEKRKMQEEKAKQQPKN